MTGEQRIIALGACPFAHLLGMEIVEARPGRYEVADPAARQQILDLRNDPKVAAVMAGAFTQRNAAQLAATLGRAPTQGELYAAHFLGPSGAGELLRKAASSPGTPATELFPEQAAANRGVFYDKATGRPKTVGELQASLAAGHERLAVPSVPKLSSDPSGWLIGRDPGRTEAPLVTAYAQADGPALHGLFRTEGPRGPGNQTVQRLWSGVSARSAGDSPRFFPRLAATSTTATDAPASGLAATGPAPTGPAPAELPGIILFHDRVRLDPAASWSDHFAAHGLCFVSVLERHGKSGAVAHGLLKDFGLKAGAVASTVGHDAHNLIVAGTNVADMRLAVETLRALRGGVCVVKNGKVLASVALPIAGLLSDERAPAVAKQTTKLKKAWLAAGCTLPYMGFNLIPLSVIPEIRITDRGLVTVPSMKKLPLFETA